jgi:hypothetical protein
MDMQELQIVHEISELNLSYNNIKNQTPKANLSRALSKPH